jgi:uncharacterized membrane protein YqhA
MPAGLLVLVDISGYTGFMQGVDEAHGEQIRASDTLPPAFPVINGLLDGIVKEMTPRFRLSEVEGDAIFAFGPDGEVDFGDKSVLACIEECYATFRTNLALAGELMFCECHACSMLSTLKLKFLFHHGGYVQHSVAGHEKIAGKDVNLAHMLLKNHVREVTGFSSYALFTDTAVKALDLPLDGATEVTEQYEGYPAVHAHAFSLN